MNWLVATLRELESQVAKLEKTIRNNLKAINYGG